MASGRGTVHTFTVTHQNRCPRSATQLPYVLAYVELEEGPRLLTNIVGCDPADVRIGHAGGGRVRRRRSATTARRSRCPRFRPGMILDLHTHSIRSDDGRAKVDNYCQWIRKQGAAARRLRAHRAPPVRRRDATTATLEDQYGLLILKASEVETDYGHVLVFGVNDDLLHALDFARIDHPLGDVLEAAKRCGAFAAPCHPAGRNVGLFAHYERKGPVDGRGGRRGLQRRQPPGEDERSGRRGGQRTATAASAAATRTS